MRALFVSLTLAGVLVLFPVPAYPQAGVPVAGSVEDGTGGVLPGVTVTLIPDGADSAATSLTDQRGRFVFLAVAPGKYRVTAEMKGFQSARRSITVAVTAVPDLKFVLRVTADEAVTVTGITRQERRTDAAENADAANFDDDLLRALPLPSTKESVLAFISEFLSPAAIGTDEVSVVVDGAESGAAGLTIPIWAIRRAVVNKDPYSPEFRRPGKARIEIITLDGSRRHFHGGAAATIQHSSMDARNAFAATKPQLDVRLAEWSLGGPIHSAVTFSTSGERLTSDEEALVNAVTPAGEVRTTVPTDRTSVKALARLDFRPAPAHTFTFRYDVNDDVARGDGVGGFELGDLAYNGSSRQQQVQLVARNVLSPDFVNSLRINLEREKGRSGQVASRPMIIVQGAFSGGAQQRARSLGETGAEIQNMSTIFTTRHTIRFGGRFAIKSVDASDASNFGGTFEFASLDDYAAGRPLVFTVNRGAPDVSFTLRETDFFIQDEVQIRPSLSVMGGVRYDWQSSIDDRRNFAPRVAMAFAPGSRKTVLRAGMGLFHERLPASVTERTLLYHGVRLQQLIMRSPSFPVAAVEGGGELVPPSVWRKSPNLETPFLFQTSVSVEREVWRRSLVTLEYAAHARIPPVPRARHQRRQPRHGHPPGQRLPQHQAGRVRPPRCAGTPLPPRSAGGSGTASRPPSGTRCRRRTMTPAALSLALASPSTRPRTVWISEPSGAPPITINATASRSRAPLIYRPASGCQRSSERTRQSPTTSRRALTTMPTRS